MSCWIEDFLDYTAGLPSPEIFRLWSGIGTVAAALERRVWVKLSGGNVYPNLYTLLVGPPAVGKTVAIEQSRDMIRGTKKLHVAPKGLTKAAMLDTVAKCAKKIPGRTPQELFEYSSLYAASPEFGVLIPAHDNEFLNVLNDIYDNPSEFSDSTRHSKSVEIIQPQINILAGTQPGYLANLLPEEAWSMGFMSRVIMVYAGSGPQVDIFNGVEMNNTARSHLIRRLVEMVGMMGPVMWESRASNELVEWYKGGMEPIPEHSRLANYVGRRLLNIVKLCIISAIARGSEMLISLSDLNRARDWLLHAEMLMPDIFHEMAGRSDGAVLEELHFYFWKIWIKNKKPIHEQRMIHFLKERVPGEKVLKVLEIAERSGMIVRQAGTSLYVPKPKQEHGLE